MPTSSIVLGTFRTAVGLACVLALGSAAPAQSTTKQSAPTIAPPLVVAKLKSSRRISVSLVSSYGYRVPIRIFGSEERHGYANEDYFRDQVINTVEMWRQYQLVPYAFGADIILEPLMEGHTVRVGVRDGKTQNVLWIFTRIVRGAIIPYHQDQNLAEAISALLDDLRRAAGQPPTAMPGQPAPPSVELPPTPRVFISYVGNWPSDSAYSRLYEGLKSSGRFDLVMAPAQADLIFEAFYVEGRRKEIESPQEDEIVKFGNASYSFFPQVMLIVRDPKTNVTPLVTTRHAPDAILPGNRRQNFSKAITSVLNDVELAFAGTGAKPSLIQTSSSGEVKQAPLPSQIAAARKIFVARPSEDNVYPTEAAVRLYEAINRGVKNWGRYEVVGELDRADLVLEPAAAGGLLRLNICDPKTAVILWGFNWGGRAQIVRPELLDSTIQHASASLLESLRELDARANGTSSPGPTTTAISSGNPGGTSVPPTVVAQLAAAKKVFVSRTQQDRSDYDDREANWDMYKKVLAALKTWQRYELMYSAADADLIFDPSMTDQDLTLTIVNPKDGGRLWTFKQHARGGITVNAREKNIDRAIAALMEDLHQAEAQGNMSADKAQEP